MSKPNTLMTSARKGYGLSCSDMSRVCGFGPNQWRLYENGKATPNTSHAKIIGIVTKPAGMMSYLKILPQSTVKEMGSDFQKVSIKVATILKAMQDQADRLFDNLNDNYFIENN